MNTKIKSGIIILGICIISGLVIFFITRDRPNDSDSLAKQTLRQAVRDAKSGNRDKILSIIEALGRGESIYVSDELLPDYISFLNDSDGQVQRLGAMGLYRTKNPKATKALFEYLKAKDFYRLEESIKKEEVDFYQSSGEVWASVVAIAALGKSGDKSAIPLLESLQGVPGLQLEMGGNPVEEALARLGAINSLTNIPPDADEEKISRASSTIMKIRDPNKVPELIATARNPKIADSIRDSAIYSIGEIGQNNPTGVSDFLIKVVGDPSYNRMLRIDAAIAAGKTKDPSVEKPLLTYTKDPNSDIRPYAFIGLVLNDPNKYIEDCFEKIMDKSENLEFRKSLTGALHLYTESDHNLLRDHKKELYNCLNTSDKEERPIDEIRIITWCRINDLFGEMPSIVLSSECNRQTLKSMLMGLSRIKSIIQSNIRQQWLKEPGNEPWNEPPSSVFEKMADEKFNKLVTFLPEETEVQK